MPNLPERPAPSPPADTPGSYTEGRPFLRVWDSPLDRTISPDFITLDAGLNGFVGLGGISKPVGGVFFLHGPEAFTSSYYMDSGIGGGMEWSAEIEFSTGRVWSSDASRITTDALSGTRIEVNLDVGEGVIGGFTGSVNIPNNNSSLVTTKGVSIGAGATSPFAVGGRINVGNTITGNDISRMYKEYKALNANNGSQQR
jgi:hypothetical protein